MKIIENLHTILNFKGYGNPNGKFWFIGMEEALEVNHPDKLKPYERGLIYNEKGDFSKHKLEFQAKKSDSRYTLVYYFIGELLRQIENKENLPLNEYLDNYLFQKNGSNFYSVLRPLGKPKFSENLKEDYLKLFGLSSPSEYLFHVENIRYPFLSNLLIRHQPKLIICFGTSLWSEYRKAFQLSASTASFDNVEYYNDRNRSFYLTPYFGNGQMSYKRIQSIADHIRNNKIL